MACCYYHPRETHVSLGIMNVHPDFFGRGLAKHLLAWILDFAKAQGKPVRLVSSALNLDSFSLYTRAGFVPVRAYQTMNLAVPDEGFAPAAEIGGAVREARPQDAKAMADLEMELCGIRRESDFAFFIENRQGIWGCSVLVGEGGAIDGFLASVNDPGSNMLGPGVARTAGGAAALIAAELDRRHRGLCPTFLAPADCPALIQTLYGWGARNSEIHFAQVWGKCPPMRGVNLPTFMPETG
ncbi:MAG: GNAT family N-acetyltransferase [Verrucomicrobiales bacterium]